MKKKKLRRSTDVRAAVLDAAPRVGPWCGTLPATSVLHRQLVQAFSLAAEALQVRESMHHVYERTHIRGQTPDAYTPPLSNWVNREMPKLRVELETSGFTVSPSTFSYR